MPFFVCFRLFSLAFASPHPRFPSFPSLRVGRTGRLTVVWLLPHIHDSFYSCMYRPRCFLLCLIQLFKAPPLHVKLHAFSPFFFLPCSSSHLYVYALSAYSYASLAHICESKARPSCQSSLLSYSCLNGTSGASQQAAPAVLTLG